MSGTGRLGRDHFPVAFRLALGGWLGCVLLQLILYARPGPYGGPFLLEWERYLGLSLYFDLLGTWLLSAPFFLAWLGLWRREVGPRPATALHLAQALLLGANLVASALDHEVLRFLGTRLTFSFLATYARPETLRDDLFHEVLAEDEGGAGWTLVALVLIPLLFGACAALIVARGRRAGGSAPLWLALAVILVPLAAPANAWLKASSQFRLRRTEPVILAFVSDLGLGLGDLQRPRDYEALAAAWRTRWLLESDDKGWTFPDPERPYLRVPLGPAAPEAEAWNVIYIQLETLRGLDTGFLGGRSPSPTPFLDSFSSRPGTAAFTHASSFGMPTINGLFASHCSITPHSSRFITGFTATALYCFPEALRRRGYRAEMFNAGDSDWDNSTIWLSRWYDRLWRFPEAGQKDRPVFRAAARRIRALGRSGRPFLASLVSVSNHTPFLGREPGFDMAGSASPSERILNTTRYTDDVLREFLGEIEGEPWFGRTLLVIVGDHGFNLGEHAVPSGQLSLYRESLWVPLLIAGAHPRLPKGRIGDPVSLLDVAPTLADLLGLREPVPWQGHSLAARGGSSLFVVQRGWSLAETGAWSAVARPADGKVELFDRRRDWLQRSPVPGRDRLALALARRAEAASRLNDYLLRNDRVWRPR